MLLPPSLLVLLGAVWFAPTPDDQAGVSAAGPVFEPPRTLAPAPPLAPQPASPKMSRLQQRQLAAWYAAVGERDEDDQFGALLVRGASVLLGKPYDYSPQRRERETLRIRFDAFECVSLVESTLALCRCVWRGERHAACFARELGSLRYRNGVMEGYASRLHYFEDWLSDNDARGHINLLTQELGGALISRPFFYMSRHPTHYPALRDPATRTAILQAEAALSHRPIAVIRREQISGMQGALIDGDIVSIMGSAPGLFSKHVGFIDRDAKGVPHFLHASSSRGRVVLTAQDVWTYVRASSGRRGIMVARPIPP